MLLCLCCWKNREKQMKKYLLLRKLFLGCLANSFLSGSCVKQAKQITLHFTSHTDCQQSACDNMLWWKLFHLYPTECPRMRDCWKQGAHNPWLHFAPLWEMFITSRKSLTLSSGTLRESFNKVLLVLATDKSPYVGIIPSPLHFLLGHF